MKLVSASAVVAGLAGGLVTAAGTGGVAVEEGVASDAWGIEEGVREGEREGEEGKRD